MKDRRDCDGLRRNGNDQLVHLKVNLVSDATGQLGRCSLHLLSFSSLRIETAPWFMAHFVLEITVYPKKYAHGFCFAVLCCGYTLTDFPISIRVTSLALWQSNDCPSASKATLMNMDKYFMWIYYERLHNHNKAKHNKTVCIFLGIYCKWRFSIDDAEPSFKF